MRSNTYRCCGRNFTRSISKSLLARHWGLVAYECGQAKRNFSWVRKMNCCFARCAATIYIWKQRFESESSQLVPGPLKGLVTKYTTGMLLLSMSLTSSLLVRISRFAWTYLSPGSRMRRVVSWDLRITPPGDERAWERGWITRPRHISFS